MRHLVHSLYGGNNLVPFDLWWSEIMIYFVQDCVRPSIKYVRSMGEGGVKTKAYIYCFMTPFYCLKAYKWGGGVWKSPNLSVSTLWMAPILYGSFTGFLNQINSTYFHDSSKRFDIPECLTDYLLLMTAVCIIYFGNFIKSTSD